MDEALVSYAKFNEEIYEARDIRKPSKCKELAIKSDKLSTELANVIVLRHHYAQEIAKTQHGEEDFKRIASNIAESCEEQMKLTLEMHQKNLETIVYLHQEAIK